MTEVTRANLSVGKGLFLAFLSLLRVDVDIILLLVRFQRCANVTVEPC